MRGLPLCFSLAYNREEAREMSERVGSWSIHSERCQSQESCDYNSKRMCAQTAERLSGIWTLSDDAFFLFSPRSLVQGKLSVRQDVRIWSF